MTAYIARRLLLLIPTLWVVSLLVFFLVRLIPGDAVEAQFAEAAGGSPEKMAAMRAELGIDRPAPEQYLLWIAGVVRGDLGLSMASGTPALVRIVERTGVSAQLAILASAVSIALAVPIGVISAVRRSRPEDYAGRMLAIGGLSIPDFVIASAIVIFPSLWWRWVPPPSYASFWEDPLVNAQQILPAAIALGAHIAAVSMRMVRSSMLEVLGFDFIRTAWAKGLNPPSVIGRHALKNALIPVITIWGGTFGGLLGGTVIIESIFGLPGVGLLTLQSIANRDYTQLQANVLYLATIYLLVNLAVDVAYAWLDPRIRYD